jgi:predicted CoA-substrate-specific enzyme activase
MDRYIGIDVGAETVKVAELRRDGTSLVLTRSEVREHRKSPGEALSAILARWDWSGVAGAAVTGRLSRQVGLPRVPPKQALAAGHRFLHGDGPATIVTIGSHGFSVLELRPGGAEIQRENSRCAQGTGNFLRQLVERFDLGVEEAAELAAKVDRGAPLGGRCPVILKTDMTHLANKGEGKDRILAGLLDAICENVQVLVKPRVAPSRVFLAGGVARSVRVQANFRTFLARHGMELVAEDAERQLLLEAVGAAVSASQRGLRVPRLDELLLPARDSELERVPALTSALARVKRMTAPPPADDGPAREVVVGLDIGSTGSKAVLVDARTRELVWQGYLRTNGDPVGAAQALTRDLLASPAARHRVLAFGATGSGREIVGSLLATCYGPGAVFVLNEIAAHATGALHYEPRVDTIFEIGGQDAKYIRLAGGRVVDAAMNEACSAGTGSFIEEQGKRFEGIENVVQLGQEALGADCGVALGQHCSIFMAEIIDEAVATGVPRERIVAGIYDSVVANYLNRVKGSRSVGEVVFCQGMPFASDALAAAVARQTGAEVVVPPNPGTVGALGIALLALDGLACETAVPMDPARFLAAKVEQKDQFVCTSTSGCGGAGNKCRIDRLTTVVEGERQKFTWGGGCSLWDKGTRKKKLPDRAPDPFRVRADALSALAARVSTRRGRKVVAMTTEFQLSGLFPFFATYVHALGFDVQVAEGGDRVALKRGIEAANVPFCAPMQQYHGIVQRMAEAKPDVLFLPMLRELPRVGEERFSTVCPIVQGSPDMLRWDLGDAGCQVVSPVVDIGAGFLDSPKFLESCRALAADLGVEQEALWKAAWRAGRIEQERFDTRLLDAGRDALAFCAETGVVPVVVLGRGYTIHNGVLNSNVPAILREQGAMAIPVEAYPVAPDAPVFDEIFWGHGQRILRASWQIRRSPGVYSIFCSNYSCGPDSFVVHGFAYLMEGRPFAVIETDGHSGDAGTKTRVEAFLHCAHEDLRAESGRAPTDESRLTVAPTELQDLRGSGERVLVPRMGPESEAVAAALRGVGVQAECLPMPTRDTLRFGRRHTSGKECLPMTITLGSLLERLDRERDTAERFAFFMPGSEGPCRFGAYRQLHQLVLDRLDWSDRVRIWSPPFGDYFKGMPPGFAAIALAGVGAIGMLEQALHDVRVVETRPGAADEIHQRARRELFALLEKECGGDLSAARVLVEVASGRCWGFPALVQRAARELLAVKGKAEIPSVLVTGEIYVRSDPFANDFVARELERRGLRPVLEPVSEFVEYADHIAHKRGRKKSVADKVERWFRARILALQHHAAAEVLGWPEHPEVGEVLRSAMPYMRDDLEVETCLTLGLALGAWRKREIDAVVSVGPLECMPNKIAEAQFCHAAEREQLHSLTLSLNGDPVDPEVLDNFAFEVHGRFRSRPRQEPGGPAPAQARIRLPILAAEE